MEPSGYGSGFLKNNDSIFNTSGLNEDITGDNIIKVSPSGLIKAYKNGDNDSKVHLMSRHAAVSNPNFNANDESIL